MSDEKAMNRIVEQVVLPLRVVSAFRRSADRVNHDFIPETREGHF